VGITFLHLDKLVKRYGKPSPRAGLNAYYPKPSPMGKVAAVRLTDEVEKYPIKKVI